MNGPTILLVEDNPDDEELARLVFQEHGRSHTLAVARDGAEALDYFFGSGAFAQGQPDARPAVVLLDLKLPKVGGLEVLRRLRAEARTRPIPVVVLSTSLEEADLAQAYALGANSYLRKPVDFDQFRALLRQTADYWLELNQPPLREGHNS